MASEGLADQDRVDTDVHGVGDAVPIEEVPAGLTAPGGLEVAGDVAEVLGAGLKLGAHLGEELSGHAARVSIGDGPR